MPPLRSQQIILMLFLTMLHRPITTLKDTSNPNCDDYFITSN